MMWRTYFICGDLLACSLAGAGTAWLVQALIPSDWPMIFGMALGMVLGMTVGTIASLFFTPLFGAMEVMLPVSLSAMVSGMWAGMAQTGTDRFFGLSDIDALQGGTVAGLACLAFTWLLQAKLRGNANIRRDTQ